MGVFARYRRKLMKKKILLLVCLLAFAICVFAISAGAEAPERYIKFDIKLSSGDGYVPAYTQNLVNSDPKLDFSADLYLDEEFTQLIDKNEIVGIDLTKAEALNSGKTVIVYISKPSAPFVNCEEFKWPSAAGSCKTISTVMFSDWTSLKSFDFGCATSIVDKAFYNCGFESVVIPSTITSVKSGAFSSNTKLKSVKFECTPEIASSTFSFCTALESADLGQITILSEGMFKDCTALKSIKIPSTITTVKKQVFYNCTSLASVELDGGIPSITESMFYKCTSLKSIVIPQGASSIDSSAFNGCAALASVTVPSSVTSIGGSAFKDCIALKSVKISSASTSFGKQVFYNCSALESVELEGSVSAITESMFYKCTSLKSIDIPYGASSIDNSAFYGCTSLASVTIPSSVTSIGGNAFNSCTALKSIDLPEGIVTFGNAVFIKSGLTSLHIPASTTTIGYQFAEETPIVSLTFAENSQLTSIGHRAFMNCKSLVGPVILPDGLETIGYGMFGGDTSLKAVKIPDSVTTIGETAMFGSCTSLEYVQLSSQLTYIPPAMFENCSSLKAISFPDSIQTLDYKVLRNCAKLQAIYLPSGLLSLGRENSSNDFGVFYQSPNVYFVQEPFNVFDGDELVANFQMPEKPSVYYMPSGLMRVASSDFQNCSQLNDVIVFPTGVTKASGCSQGAFFNIGTARTASNPITLVFLGNMESLIIRQNDNSYCNINFVFANPADKSLSDVTVTIGAANNKTQTGTQMYFCNGNTVYDLSTFKAANAAAYTVQETDFAKTVYAAEEQPHFADPNKTTSVDATCETNRGEVRYCFCGASMGLVGVEGTALGHEFELENGATLIGIVYANGFGANGYKQIKCARCTANDESGVASPIFDGFGYSTREESDLRCGMVMSYVVDMDALREYENVTGTALSYGVLAIAKPNVSGNPLGADGSTDNESITTTSVTGTKAVDLIIWGSRAAWNAALTDGTVVKALEFYLTGYVIVNNELTYFCGAESSKELVNLNTTSYNKINP